MRVRLKFPDGRVIDRSFVDEPAVIELYPLEPGKEIFQVRLPGGCTLLSNQESGIHISECIIDGAEVK